MPEERRDYDGHTQQIARDAGREGAKETLQTLGVDVDDVPTAQADFMTLRQVRRAKEVVARAGVWVLTVSGVSAIIAWVQNSNGGGS